jgi:predicted ATPase
MNKIGFKNFRRFIEFKPLEYKGITFLVGRNNAGKSTMVKALLLISDFLKSNTVRSFPFGRNVLEDVNIVTYDRAKNILAKDDFISFNYQLDNFLIDIKISGLADATSADVHLFSIKDMEQGFELIFEPQKTLFTIAGLPQSNIETEPEIDNTLLVLQEQLKSAKDELKTFDDASNSLEYFDKIGILKELEKKVKNIKEIKKSQKSNTAIFSVNAHIEVIKPLTQIFDDFVTEMLSNHTVKFNEVQSGKKQTKEFENLKVFKEEVFAIEKSFKNFIQSIQSLSLIYLGANPAKQSALFQIRDKNNALAQAVHDFYQLRIYKGEVAFEFVEKWMKAFDVGESFDITIYAGESYEVKINSHGKLIHLADKGMGSIQAMLLIFRLASIIHKSKDYSFKPIVVIEEPELNLHPKLQGLLADLFLEVKEKHKINFIIETHSEYIIRKTQLFVKNNEYEVAPNENPLCVIYFDNEDGPYNMNYRQDGVFIQDFGSGFFDVSSQQALQLIKKSVK